MNSETALAEIGIDEQTLTITQKSQLDHEGYIVFPEILSSQDCATMRERLNEIAREEGERAGKDFHTEMGTTRLGSLLHKDALFDICVTHPLVLASIAHITHNDFGLSSITSRVALPGEGHQPLHCDFDPEGPYAANALWLLDPFTPNNGPTRLVPRSHLKRAHPASEGNPSQPYPDEIHVIAPAGTLIIINAFLWHGGTRNTTAQPRHLISAFFTARGHYQRIAHRTWTSELEKRMGPATKYLMDYQLA